MQKTRFGVEGIELKQALYMNQHGHVTSPPVSSKLLECYSIYTMNNPDNNNNIEHLLHALVENTYSGV